MRRIVIGILPQQKMRERAIAIARLQPASIAELSQRTGRAPSNLSRTLKRLAHYGFVLLERGPGNIVRPVAQAIEYDIRAIAA